MYFRSQPVVKYNVGLKALLRGGGVGVASQGRCFVMVCFIYSKLLLGSGFIGRFKKIIKRYKEARYKPHIMR